MTILTMAGGETAPRKTVIPERVRAPLGARHLVESKMMRRLNPAGAQVYPKAQQAERDDQASAAKQHDAHRRRIAGLNA